MSKPTIVVLAGGVSAEREVSLSSGQACAMALSRNYPTRLCEVSADTLPTDLDGQCDVVFSTLHGTFGEDGGMPKLLEAAGINYAGCAVESSALLMNKSRTKQVMKEHGLAGPREWLVTADALPTADAIMEKLGNLLIVKPNAEGSSVGLRLVANADDLREALDQISTGEWLIEERIMGREFSVGVLHGKSMGVVEIRPKSGVYDYKSKYTKGMTEYFAPAPIDEKLTVRLQELSAMCYEVCGCRDYARVDFMMSESGDVYLLEINTLPGMKETSLLPMSASCAGLDFTALVREMVAPAVSRFSEYKERQSVE
jgi:D-alanine-D-alanine ligase